MTDTAPTSMTAQEVFDAAVTHLFTMPRKAADGYSCRYRTEDGGRCLVGALIRDDEFKPEMEGNAVMVIDLPPRLVPHRDLLQNLQSVHDDHLEGVWEDYGHGPLNHDAARWRVGRLALRFNLTVPAIAA